MIKLINICHLMVGDTIIHNDKLMTVSNSDINRDEFMGITVFGDSYNLGYKPIKKVIL
jgi:hypothetical protein